LDLGKDGLTGGWGGWDNGGSWGWSGSIGEWGGWSMSVKSRVGIESWVSKSTISKGKGGSWGGSLGAAGSLIKSGLELSLGSLDLWGVFDWGWCDSSVDWGLQVENWSLQGGNLWCGWGNWQVAGNDTEAKSISNVVGGLEDTVGINIAIGSSYSTVGIADLVLGRVDVGVAISSVLELILSLELAGHSWGWDSWGNDWSSSGVCGDSCWGNGCWGNSCVGVCWGSQWETSIAVSVSCAVWGVEWVLGLGGGAEGGNNSNKSLHFGENCSVEVVSVRS